MTIFAQQLRRAALLLAGTLLLSPARAQTPLTAADFSTDPAVVERFARLDVPTVAPPPLATGANQTWDFRTLSFQPNGYFTSTYDSIPAGAPFTGSNLRCFTGSTVVGGLDITTRFYQRVAPDGLWEEGYTTADYRQDLSVVTGSTLDSVVIPAQTVRYAPAVRVLPLPFGPGTVSRVVSRFGIRARLTVAAAGLNRTPFRCVRRYLRADSCAGWGTVQVPVVGIPGGSAPIAALLRRTTVVWQDSFYLGNAPAPAALLSVLGLSQGGVTLAVWRDDFMRPGSQQYLLRVIYDNPDRLGMAGAIVSAELGLPLGLAAAAAAEAPATLWPNPATAGQALRVEVAGLTAAVPATLRDALGRAVLSTTLRPGEPLPLPATLAPGTYLLTAPLPDGRAVRRRVVVAE